MALAFKRAQADAEKAVEAANKKIADNYKTTVSPALIVDYDSIKAVEGVSKFNTNSQELPKNITLCNWVKEYADRFHSVWGDVQYRDKKHALPIMLQHVDKVILHLDDKSPAGKYNTYEVKAQGKDIHLHLHFDFTQMPQPLSLTDEKGGHVINALWAHLDDVANITYLVRKANQAEKDGSYLNKYKKELKEKAKKDIAFEVDFDSIDKLTGKGIESSNRPVVPNKARVINWMEDGDKGLMSVWWAVEKLLKDDLGREAFGESFKKVLVSVEGNSKETRGGPHKVVKEGDILRFVLNFNLDNLQNTNVDHSGLAKEIEKML